MNLERFTDRSQGFIQSAHSLALMEGHQRITPEHLLKVLLDDKQGAITHLMSASGADAMFAKKEVAKAIDALPKVETDGEPQIFVSPELARVLAQAEVLADKAGDEYIAVERLFMAMLFKGAGKVQDILKHSGLTAEALNAAINKIRGGRTADSTNAEGQYAALEKYAIDVTAQARDGKLDPVIGRDEEIRRTMQVLSRRSKTTPY